MFTMSYDFRVNTPKLENRQTSVASLVRTGESIAARRAFVICRQL
jgi:hypothetical protein